MTTKSTTPQADSGNQDEIVGIIGANCAGKSTDLMAVSRIMRPRSGSMRWSDTDLAAPAVLLAAGTEYAVSCRDR